MRSFKVQNSLWKEGLERLERAKYFPNVHLYSAFKLSQTIFFASKNDEQKLFCFVSKIFVFTYFLSLSLLYYTCMLKKVTAELVNQSYWNAYC